MNSIFCDQPWSNCFVDGWHSKWDTVCLKTNNQGGILKWDICSHSAGNGANGTDPAVGNQKAINCANKGRMVMNNPDICFRHRLTLNRLFFALFLIWRLVASSFSIITSLSPESVSSFLVLSFLLNSRSFWQRNLPPRLFASAAA